MAYSIAIFGRELPHSTFSASSPAALLRHAPLLGTAVLEFAGLIAFLGVCVGLIAEFS